MHIKIKKEIQSLFQKKISETNCHALGEMCRSIYIHNTICIILAERQYMYLEADTSYGILYYY